MLDCGPGSLARALALLAGGAPQAVFFARWWWTAPAAACTESDRRRVGKGLASVIPCFPAVHMSTSISATGDHTIRERASIDAAA